MSAVRRNAEKNGLHFPIALDNDSATWNAWANRIWPSTYVIDKTGHVRFWWYGELQGPGVTGGKALAERIEALIAEGEEP